MFAAIFAVFTVLLFIALDTNDARPRLTTNICKVPNADGGTCTLLNNCTPLMDISKKKQKTEMEDGFFRQSVASCGSRGTKLKVCCPPPSQWSKITVSPVIFPEAPFVATNIKPVGHVDKPNMDDIDNRIIKTSDTKPNASITGFEPFLNFLHQSGQVESVCGVDVSSAHRIVGGNATDIDEYPWLALLEYGEDDYRCGGSLISKSHVLTAAHCLYTTPEKVRLSEYNLTTFPMDAVEANGGGFDNITVTIVPVLWALRHPGHKYLTSIADIGIVKMASPVNFTDFIKPICLPTVDYQAEFIKTTNFTVAGWGGDGQFTRSEVKRAVIVPYVTFDQCQKSYPFTKMYREQHLCAGGEEGKDSCRGDSGGPLMWESKSSYVIVGIVSSGVQKCGSAGVPAIYTYVYHYVDWITRML